MFYLRDMKESYSPIKIKCKVKGRLVIFYVGSGAQSITLTDAFNRV